MWTRNDWLRFAVGLAIGLVIAGGGAFIALQSIHRPESDATFNQEDPVQRDTQKIFPGMRPNYSGEGVFKVPSQTPPGVYLISSPGIGCKWQRLKSLSHKPKDQLDGGLLNKGGFDTVRVLPTDKFFEIMGECTVTLSEVK